MATSVPDPTARPRSATARAGRRSPRRPPWPPSGPRPGGTGPGHLLGRQGARHDLVDPHRPRATARAVALVVAGQKHAAQAQGPQRADGVGRRGPHGVGEGQCPHHRTVARPPDHRAARTGLPSGAGTRPPRPGSFDPPAARAGPPRPGDPRPCPSPRARRASNSSTGGSGPNSAAGRLGHGTGDERARRPVPAPRPSAAPDRARTPGAAAHSATVILPVVSVPVLSSTTVSTWRRPLQGRVALEEDPLTGPLARGHQQGRRGGQAQRAGAGDDEDAEGRADGVPAPPPATSQPPRVAAAMARTAGTKTPEIRSASRWTAAFSFWASSTRRGHLGQLGVGTHPGGPHHQPPADRHRPPVDLVAGDHLDGHRLTGHGAAIEGEPGRRPPRRRWPPSRPAGPRTAPPPRARRPDGGAPRRQSSRIEHLLGADRGQRA